LHQAHSSISNSESKEELTMIDPNTPNHKLFGKHADARMAQELFKNNRPEYNRRRAEAERDGLLAPKPVWADPDYRKRFDPVQKSEADLRLLADAPLVADAMKYYGSGPSSGGTDTLSRLAQENPERYKQVRACAIAKNLIEDRPAQPMPEVKPASQWTVVPDADCDACGLPRGYRTNQSGLETIRRVVQEVAAVKATADAQAKAQAERDHKTDESVATFGSLRETDELRRWKADQRAAIAAEQALADRDAAVKKAA
jgi:hypothetical protein